MTGGGKKPHPADAVGSGSSGATPGTGMQPTKQPTRTQPRGVGGGTTGAPSENRNAATQTSPDRRTAGGGGSGRRSPCPPGPPPPPPPRNRRRRLQDGMATALSLDHWSAPPSSGCRCDDSPDLSVNFLCMHPATQEAQQRRDDNHCRGGRLGPDRGDASDGDGQFFSRGRDGGNALGPGESGGGGSHRAEGEARIDGGGNVGNNDRRGEDINAGTDSSSKNNHNNDGSANGEEYWTWPHSSSGTAAAPPPDKRTAARFQEIFVDLCALHASTHDAASRHVLDSRFDSFLGSGEREFKRIVLDLVGYGGGRGGGSGSGSSGIVLTDEARQTSAYRRLESMLRREMGLGALDERQEMRVRKMRGLRRCSTGSFRVPAHGNGGGSGCAGIGVSTDDAAAADVNGAAQAEGGSRGDARAVDSLPSTDSTASTATAATAATTEMTACSSEASCSSGSSCGQDGRGEQQHAARAQEQHPMADAADVLRGIIAQIRSDDDLLRRFALAGRTGNRDGDGDGDGIDGNDVELAAGLLSYVAIPRAANAIGSTTPGDDGGDGRLLSPVQIARLALGRTEDPGRISLAPAPAASHHLAREREAFRRLLRPPGHVFVCNASVCDVSCDAFLCPGRISVKKDTVVGTIYKRWYGNLKKTNPRLLQLLRGDGAGTGSTGSGEMARRGGGGGEGRRSRSNSYGSDSDRASGSGRGRSAFAQIPMKRYPKFDRVVTPKHWPWDEFRKKEEDQQMCGRLTRWPLLVAGEVSIERSRLGQPHSNEWHKFTPSEQDQINALMETVRQFVSASLEELRREQPCPRSKRERFLLALPVVGTGGGYAGDLTGQIVENMITVLSDIVSKHDDVDCVLVCADLATFSHAQNVRWKMCKYLGCSGGLMQPKQEQGENIFEQQQTSLSKDKFDDVEPLSSFRLLSAEMRENARQLAKLASKGHLSMFIGAGVSMGAGLPSWTDLLLGVEDQFTMNGLPMERMLGNSSGKIDPLAIADWLGILCASRPDRYGHRRDLKERIATIIEERSQHPSLLMSLLTSLPCKSIVTQNYDRMIERAFKCRNVAEKKRAADSGDDAPIEALSVIPHAPVRGADRWLLKMHGCVSSHESIVITSEDYRNYESGRKKALAGLVQANLMTTHLLFVGFSLSDPNYLRIIEEVRHALKPGQHEMDEGNAVPSK